MALVASVTIPACGGSGSSGSGAASTAEAGLKFAACVRRNLVTSENETGTISYADTSTVANRLQGTLTWVPAVGRVIDPGQRLFDVTTSR